jgi:hypothetical protein
MSGTQIAYHATIDLDAISVQLEAWQTANPDLGVMVYLPESEQDALSALQALFRERGIPLVGAIFPEIIVEGRFHHDGVLLYCFVEMPHYLLKEGFEQPGEPLNERCENLAADITSQIEGKNDSYSLFLLFDAMLPHVGHILEALYLELADRVHYMGINAGSERFEPMPCLFDAERVIENGVLALLLPHHHGATLEHGYRVPEQLIAATSTDGNRIINIDWRPAFEVYAERVEAQYGVAITAENFYQYGVHFPFGIMRADSEVLVRIPVALMEDGSLFCVGEIPPNAVLTLLNAPAADSVHTAKQLAERFLHPNDGAPLLTFYCAGRRLHFGADSAQSELQILAGQLGHAPLYGALSLGEIGSSQRGGYPLFHNAALVLSEI